MKRVIGLGAGGHARVIIEILEAMGGHRIVGLLDPEPSLWGREVGGVPVLGDDGLLTGLGAQGVTSAFVGVGSVGDAELRRRLWEKVVEHGFEIVSAIHPRALISPSAELGPGCIVMAGAVIGSCVVLGRNVIVNTGAIVDHDCRIGDHAHIATGASLASAVRVMDEAHVGVGASVRQEVTIGRGSVVGAGAAVVEDVPDDDIVVGVPARRLRERASPLGSGAASKQGRRP